MAYTEAVRLAYVKEAGYNLKEYQEIKDSNVDIGGSWIRTVLRNPFKTELTKKKKAKTRNFSADTVEALEKLYLCDLTNDGIIKSATCVLSESDKYYITIVLNDEIDVEGTDSLTSCIFPVVDREDMNEKLENDEKTWYNARNTDFNYRITYTGCTLNAIVDVQSGNIENIDMSIGYKFDVWGQIMLSKISNRSFGSNTLSYVNAKGETVTDTVAGKYKVGTAYRTDTVKYSDFNYVVPGLEVASTTEAPATLPDKYDGDPVEIPSTTGSNSSANNFLSGIGNTLKGLVGGLFNR